MFNLKSNKKKNNKINFGDQKKKKQILIVIFAFVVVGTAILIRSYASTPVSISTINKHPGSVLQYSNDKGGYCKSSATYDNGWQFDVAVLTCSKAPYEILHGSYAKGTNYKAKSSGNYKVCAWVKGASTRVVVTLSETHSSGSHYAVRSIASHKIYNNSSYSYFCTGSYYFFKDYYLQGSVQINTSINNASFISVASINIEKL